MNRHLQYPGMKPDGMARAYVPPVRVVRHSDNVRNSEILPGRLETQSYVHFDPALCIMEPGSELVLDFGIELHGQLALTSGGREAAQLRITLGESLSEALGTPNPDHAVHQAVMPLPKLGQFFFGNSAFRFVRIELPPDQPEVKLMAVAALAVYRDWEYAGSFESDDERLNKIWATGAYTVHLNCQDYIYDGVKRDRLVWMGDLYPEIRTLLYVFRESDLVGKSLDFVRDRTPHDKWMNTASSYSCWWILCLHALYLYRGDYAYLAAQRNELAFLLRRLLGCIGPDGREALTEWRFLDWSTADNDAAKHAGLQGLLAWTLDTGATLIEILRDDALAAECRKAAAVLRQTMPDCGANKIAAAMQSCGGAPDAEAFDAIFRKQPAKGISTFYGYFVLLARAKNGDVKGALKLIRDYWGAMLDFGATTFWEDFDLDWTRNSYGIDSLPVPGKRDIHGDFGKYCYQGLRHSLCHGWAGGPTAFLSETVLGVRPTEPGYRTVTITPQLGNLKYVKGTVPTPFGEITVEADPKGTQITLPPGITAIQ